MDETFSTTSFDQLSVGQPPPTASPYKPETEMNSALMSDDWRLATSDKDKGLLQPLTGDVVVRTAVPRRRRRQEPEMTAESTGFVGLMQQLAVDGRELFELAERGHLDVVDSTATKDVSGGPLTFTSPDAYLSLTSTTQSLTFSIYFRVSFSASHYKYLLCGHLV